MNDKLTDFLQRIELATGAELWFVGGAVRDDLLGVPSNDIDLVSVGVQQDQLIEDLESFGRVEITGAKFGVIRFFPNDRSLPFLEISLPRKEVSTGSGHKDFVVEFDHTLDLDWDLYRRDFTINSFAKSVKTGEVISVEGAREDLLHKRIRFISDTSASDDPLRMLRAIRFLSKLDGFRLSEVTAGQIRANAHLLEHVSAERVQEELLKIIMGRNVGNALRTAQSLGIISQILPELEACVGVEQNHYHAYDVWNHIVKVVENCPSNDPYTRLACLFHDVGKAPTRWKGMDGVYHFYSPEPGQEFLEEPQVIGDHETVGAEITRDIMNRLRFSKPNVDRVSQMVRWHMFIQKRDLGRKAARKLLANLSTMPGDLRENVNAMFDLREADCRGGKPGIEVEKIVEMNRDFHKLLLEEIEKESAVKVTDLAIGGADLIELNLTPGPLFSKILNELLDLVVDDPSLNDRDMLLERVRVEYKDMLKV